MKQSTVIKLSAIIANWKNGNKTDAIDAVRKLKRLELVWLLTQQSRLNQGFNDRLQKIQFEDFVALALETA
jgi:hypothetical protein